MTIIDETPSDRSTVQGWGRRLEGLRHLYRYRSIEKPGRLEETVLRSKLHLSRFPDLNDPFDGKVDLDYGAAPERIRAFWEANRLEGGKPIDTAARTRIQAFIDGRDDPAVHEQLRAIHRDAIDKLRVVCFSEPQDDIPMWSYYANSQQGVCLKVPRPTAPRMEGQFSADARHLLEGLPQSRVLRRQPVPAHSGDRCHQGEGLEA